MPGCPTFRLAVGCAAVVLRASVAVGQPVLLQIRPQVGDTFRVRLDQRVEMSGTTRLGKVDSTMSVTTTLFVLTRAIVEARDQTGTLMLATTDSVLLWTDGADSTSAAAEARRALHGKRVRLHVAPDGSTEVVSGDGYVSPELRTLFAQMPATLPREEVTVGSKWLRVMAIPMTKESADRGGGTLKATFRFDSLSRNGEWAYLSMSGTLTRSPAAATERQGTTLAMSGSVLGSMIVDRRRGWITDARATFTVRSLMTPPTGSTARPLRFRMKVTQWMRAVQ